MNSITERIENIIDYSVVGCVNNVMVFIIEILTTLNKK